MASESLTKNVRFRHLCRIIDAFLPELGKVELDRFLSRFFKEHLKGAGKRDRRWYAETAFGLFRNIVAVLGPISRKDARTRMSEWGAEKLLSTYSERLEQAAELTPQSVLFFEDHARLDRRAKRSDWSEEDRSKFLKNLTLQAPLWVRVPGEGVTGQARRLDDRATLMTLPAGTQIQDLASQRIGEAVQTKPGERILDLCAGAGGKTLQIADDLRGRGQVVATDTRAHALDRILERASDAQRSVIQLAHSSDPGSGFDAVLVDTPCTGSGSWRRRPDQMLLAEAETFNGLQIELLRKAATLVRPGGRLIYATCSWFTEENEDLVSQFSTHFACQMLGSPKEDSDTMFVAAL